MQQRGVVDTLIQYLVFGTKNMAIVLCEAAHPHDAVQATGGLVAVTLTKLAIAQGQVAVAFDALLEDQNMPRAVHRLERIFTFFRLCGEHVFAVLVPVAGFLPEGFVNNLRAFDLQVAVVTVHLPHVLFHALPQGPALRMPKHQAGGVVVDMEQIEFAAEFSVITLIGFFEHGQVLLQVFFAGPGCAIHPLQHFIAVVAAPIGASQLHQFKKSQLSGAGHVGPTTQILKRTLAVQRDIFAGRYAGNDFSLVVLTLPLKMGYRLIARQHPPGDGLIFCGEFKHLFLNRQQIFRRERALV